MNNTYPQLTHMLCFRFDVLRPPRLVTSPVIQGLYLTYLFHDGVGTGRSKYRYIQQEQFFKN